MNSKDPLSLRIVVTSEEGVEWDGGGLQGKFQLYSHLLVPEKQAWQNVNSTQV